MFYLYAAGEIDIAPTPENVEKIDAAISDLDYSEKVSRSGAYWKRIRARLMDNSASNDPEDAVKEWGYTRMWASRGGTCELCDHHPITFHYQIENRLNAKSLVVGSECIYNYLEIPGVPRRDILKRRLNQLRTRARAVSKGELAPEAIQKLEEVQAYERKLNILIAKVAAPEKDLDIDDLAQALNEPMYAGSTLEIRGAGFKALEKSQTAIRNLIPFLNSIGKRTTKYKTHELLPAVEAIMRFRKASDEDKIGLLQTMENHIQEAFTVGPAKDLVQMAWAEVKNSRLDAYDVALETAKDAKKKCQDQYAEQIALVRPYNFLHRVLQDGIDANAEQMDEQLKKYKVYLNSEDFPAGFRDAKPYFVAYLSKGESPIEDAAYRLINFLRQLDPLYSLTGTIYQRWYLRELRDKTGVKKAILLAANEGYIDVERDDRAMTTLEDKIRKGDEEVVALFEREVDDIKAKVVEDKVKNYQAMSEHIGADMEKFYKACPQDNPFLPSFCKNLFDRWMKGQRNWSYKERGVIDKQLARGGHEVPNNMWDVMKTSLTGKYYPMYGR